MSSNELIEKYSKVGIKSKTIGNSEFFNKKVSAPTDIPIINAALSAKFDGGLTAGLTFLAGPSKHFKSLLGLLLVKAYMAKHPDSICFFYDSEFGITPEYIRSNGLDPNRVLHIPIANVEELKFDFAKKLEEMKRGEKAIFFIDSIGNLASKKELEDAIDGKSVADMSRARAMKSLWRIVTPYLTKLDIPCVAVNHTYQTIEMYSKSVMSGGTGGMYSANQVFIIGKAQEKQGTDLVGWNFTINIEKSRFVKEKSKFTFTVTYEGGISRWSGLLDLALESGHVIKPSNGWYQKADEEKKYREADTNTKDFWLPVLSDKSFQEFTEKKFSVAYGALVHDDDTTEEVYENLDLEDEIDDEEA